MQILGHLLFFLFFFKLIIAHSSITTPSVLFFHSSPTTQGSFNNSQPIFRPSITKITNNELVMAETTQSELVPELSSIFEPTRCVKYTGSYCAPFFGTDFYVGLNDVATIQDREHEIFMRRMKFLTAPTSVQCDSRALANLCGRAYTPCRIKESMDDVTGEVSTRVIPIPYCWDCCSNLRCPVSSTLAVDTRICYDPYLGSQNKLSIPEGYSCEASLNWSRISEYDLSAAIQNILPNCPEPLINVDAGNPFAFYGSYCASPCPPSIYTKQQYKLHDIIFTLLNILSIIGLLIISVSWYMFPRLRVKQYVYFYIASICLITFSLTILIFISWSNHSGISAALCKTSSSEFHMAGYPLVQGLVCLFFFMAATCWSLVCSFDLFLIIVFGINITQKHKYYFPTQIAYHVFCWGFALYAIIGPLSYSQIGASTVGGSFAWIGAPRSDYVRQQNTQLASDSTSNSSYDYNTIYDSGNAFFYIPLWIVTGLSVVLVSIALIKLFRYNCCHRKKTVIVAQDGSMKIVSTRIGNLSIETFVRLLIFTLSNICISLVFAFHKLLVVDQRGTLDIDETLYFMCLTGALVLFTNDSSYYTFCQRHQSLSPTSAILLSALLNSMGLIAFLTYGTTPSLWKAWAGLISVKFEFQPFVRYRDFYLQALQPSTHYNTPRNAQPEHPDEEVFHFSETTRRRPDVKNKDATSTSYNLDSSTQHERGGDNLKRINRKNSSQPPRAQSRPSNRSSPTANFLPQVINAMAYQNQNRRSNTDGSTDYDRNGQHRTTQTFGDIQEHISREDGPNGDNDDDSPDYDEPSDDNHPYIQNSVLQNHSSNTKTSSNQTSRSANSNRSKNTKAGQFNHKSRQNLEDQKVRNNIARQQQIQQLPITPTNTTLPTLFISSSQHSSGGIMSNNQHGQYGQYGQHGQHGQHGPHGQHGSGNENNDISFDSLKIHPNSSSAADPTTGQSILIVPLSPSNLSNEKDINHNKSRGNLPTSDISSTSSNQLLIFPQSMYHSTPTATASTPLSMKTLQHQNIETTSPRIDINFPQSSNISTTATTPNSQTNGSSRQPLLGRKSSITDDDNTTDLDQRTKLTAGSLHSRGQNLPPLITNSLLQDLNPQSTPRTNRTALSNQASDDHDTISSPQPLFALNLISNPDIIDEEDFKRISFAPSSRSSSATDPNGNIYSMQPSTPITGLGLNLNEVVIISPHGHPATPATRPSTPRSSSDMIATPLANAGIPSSTIQQQPGIRIHSIGDNITVTGTLPEHYSMKTTGAHFTPKLPAQYINVSPPTTFQLGLSPLTPSTAGISSPLHPLHPSKPLPTPQFASRAIDNTATSATQSRINLHIAGSATPTIGGTDLELGQVVDLRNSRPTSTATRGQSVEPQKKNNKDGSNGTKTGPTAKKSERDGDYDNFNGPASNADDLLLRLQQFKLEDSFSLSDDDSI